MKKILSRSGWLVVAAALTMGLSACSGSEDIATGEPANPTQPKVYTMTVQASKGDNATTRALSYNDGTKKLNATWATGEKVYVYNNSKNATLDGSLEAKSGGATVTLEGNLTGTVVAGDMLTLGFPGLNENYTGQDGTLEKIALKYDYALAWATVTKVTDGKITAENYETGGSVQFENQQAIVRFTLVNKADNSSINATSLTIEAKDASSADKLIQTLDFTSSEPTPTYGPITIMPSATNVIYAALATAESNDSYDYTLTATDQDGYTNIYTKSGVKFEYGKYYEITVKMSNVIGQSGTGGNGSEISPEITPIHTTPVKVGIINSMEQAGNPVKYYYQFIDSGSRIIASYPMKEDTSAYVDKTLNDNVYNFHMYTADVSIPSGATGYKIANDNGSIMLRNATDLTKLNIYIYELGDKFYCE